MMRIFFLLFFCHFLAGCQGQLDFVFLNKTTEDIIIIAEEKAFFVSSNQECRIAVPSDQKLFIKGSGAKFLFHGPFYRYSVSENEYITSKNTIYVQIKTSDTIIFIPTPQASSNTVPLLIKGTETGS